MFLFFGQIWGWCSYKQCSYKKESVYLIWHETPCASQLLKKLSTDQLQRQLNKKRCKLRLRFHLFVFLHLGREKFPSDPLKMLKGFLFVFRHLTLYVTNGPHHLIQGISQYSLISYYYSYLLASDVWILDTDIITSTAQLKPSIWSSNNGQNKNRTVNFCFGTENCLYF